MMQGQLCLQAVDAAEQSQLLELLEGIFPGVKQKHVLKENYLAFNDMYKYNSVSLQLPKEWGYKLQCNFGSLLVRDKVYPIAEILISYKLGATAHVAVLVQRLLASDLQFILVDPVMEYRLEQLRGTYNPALRQDFTAESLDSALKILVPWQVYPLNYGWSRLMEATDEKNTLRQVRVKLRRLRSLLKLLLPLYKNGQSKNWSALLKRQADLLSDAREYDVMLMLCAKLELDLATSPLVQHIQELRQLKELDIREQGRLNQFTQQLALMLLDFYALQSREGSLEDFLGKRLRKWCRKLQQELAECQHEEDQVRLHQVRIHIKRFRYGIQSVPGFAGSSSLRRALKNIQDDLGILHDQYVNQQFLDGLVGLYAENKQLELDVALLGGWGQAKAQELMEQVPTMFAELELLLREWEQGV